MTTGNFSSTQPREFGDFLGHHQGESILVCGCGSSLSKLKAPHRFVTIGVNDVGRLFDPDYLVVLNPAGQFAGDRFSYVRQSRAQTIFTQLNLEIDHPHVVRFRLGKRGSADFSDPGALPYTRNSPYVAVALAKHMGAKHIGVIGVDFTENHFFAASGRHPLHGELQQIKSEYALLVDRCRSEGTEVYNLSSESQLSTIPRMTQEDFFRRSLPPFAFAGSKVFFVNFNFRSCGDLFRQGLTSAAADLDLACQAASWDDAHLASKLEAFDPDLVFVVHGRKFCQRWPTGFPRYRSAVWLLDEPYEVDDTARFSSRFDTVFLNDPATIGRHRNAHYLPVAYDPGLHTYLSNEDRPYCAGFIGGTNPWREQALGGLARRGLLSYVVGGPFHHPNLKPILRADCVSPAGAAALYRQSKIIVNLFRTQHHYNREGVAAFSLNPRVYEGVACGGLVISEYRSEADKLCPELPVFRTAQELELQVEHYLSDADHFERVRKACLRRLAHHSYAHRLHAALTLAFNTNATTRHLVELSPGKTVAVPIPAPTTATLSLELTADWKWPDSNVKPCGDGELCLRTDAGDLTERGLRGKDKLGNVCLEFEVQLQIDTRFIAKIHEEERGRLGNSYHLVCAGGEGYLARHNRIFARFRLPLGVWVPFTLCYSDGLILVRRSGAEIARIADRMLEAGYCFLGIMAGSAALRNIRVKQPRNDWSQAAPARVPSTPPAHAANSPTVSIVTTVYDRLDCLERCIRSVQALQFKDYEHIIVADCPPAGIVAQIRSLIARYATGSTALHFSTLNTRNNDWGIAPAAVGLKLAQGKYVCFLSDDNGYLPQHFNKLVAILNRNQHLGFVYSSCLYAGRLVLRTSTPAPASIDLGQPLFRRELFDLHLGGKLPFHEFGWDWRLIETFLLKGVRWEHVNDATFIFRLAHYPHLLASNAVPRPQRPLVSYCVACLRPVYACQLIEELIGKTTVPAEILLWMNVDAPDFEQFVAAKVAAGANIQIIGRTPQNIGMAAYWQLFKASTAEMVVQIDDDVVCISPRIAETAREVFARFPQVGMLTADVWQDEYTTGARPPLQHYRVFDQQYGLYDGPIDGWFAVYRKTSLSVCNRIHPARYLALGASIKAQLASERCAALLCTRMQVFHITGPAYVSHFGMLEDEIRKYQEVGRDDMVSWYRNATLPPDTDLSTRVALIRRSLSAPPATVPA